MGSAARIVRGFVLLVALCAMVRCIEEDVVTVPQVVQNQLLSFYSGRFVGVSTNGDIHAMGAINGER